MYVPLAGISIETIAVSRRSFLQAGALLGISLSGCRGFLSETRFVDAMLTDPHPDAYHPILNKLIRAILPFGHPQFPPISSETIEARLLSYFPVDDNVQFLPLQKSLIFFDATELFPQIFSPVENEERNDNAGENEATVESMIAAKRDHDKKLYESFVSSFTPSAHQYTELDLRQQREYLRLWGQSGFRIKRQFYRSLKSIVMITAYSTDDLWKVIEYEGPLLSRY